MSNISEDDVISQEESALPKEFEQLYSSVNVESSSEALVVLLHSCMLNVGFLPINIEERNALKSMPATWRAKGAWKFQYCHKTCYEETCWMTCVPLYSYLAVHGSVENFAPVNVYLKLKIPSYVNEESDLSNIEELFINCKELVRKFKDGFCFPLLALLQQSAGCEPSFGLSAIVEDIKLHLFKQLPVQSVLALSSVNKDFNRVANSNALWEHLLRRDFGLVDCQPGVTNKEKYRREYLKKKQKARRLGRIVDPMFHPPVFPPLRQPAYLQFDRGLDPAIRRAFPYLDDRYRPYWYLHPYDF